MVIIFTIKSNPSGGAVNHGGQFYDRGESYGIAIFYSGEEQKAAAEASKKALAAFSRYRDASGRDDYFDKIRGADRVGF